LAFVIPITPNSSKIFCRSGSKVSKLTGPVALSAFSKIPNRSAACLIAEFVF